MAGTSIKELTGYLSRSELSKLFQRSLQPGCVSRHGQLALGGSSAACRWLGCSYPGCYCRPCPALFVTHGCNPELRAKPHLHLVLQTLATHFSFHSCGACCTPAQLLPTVSPSPQKQLCSSPRSPAPPS